MVIDLLTNASLYTGLGERIARARQLRTGLSTAKFRARDIDTLKRQGRP